MTGEGSSIPEQEFQREWRFDPKCPYWFDDSWPCKLSATHVLALGYRVQDFAEALVDRMGMDVMVYEDKPRHIGMVHIACVMEKGEADQDTDKEEVKPVPPPAPPLDIADTCDGVEQGAFEEWAGAERYDMSRHPLHWMFLNERTYAARQGWRAGIAHARARLLASQTPPEA